MNAAPRLADDSSVAARPTCTESGGVVAVRRMLALYQAEDYPHSADVREKLTALGGSYVTHTPR